MSVVKKLATVFIIATLGSIALYSVHIVQPIIALIALSVIWASFIPSVVYFIISTRDTAPFFPAIGVFYAIFFGLPVFTIPLAWKDSKSIDLYTSLKNQEEVIISTTINNIRPEVMWLLLFAITLMIITFYFSRSLIWSKVSSFTIPATVGKKGVKPLMWVLLISHLSYNLFPPLQRIDSIGQFLDPAGLFAFGSFYLLGRRSRLSTTEIIVLICICFPIEIYCRIRILYITDLLLLLIFCVFIFWRERQLKLLTFCSILIFSVLSIYGASTAVRNSATTTTEKILLLGQAFNEHLIKGKNKWGPTWSVNPEHSNNRPGEHRPFVFGNRVSSLVKRTSQLWVFHVVDNMSPNPIPYWGGTTYLPLLTSLIPRLIYPDKPEERTGVKFGQRYKFFIKQDITSLNLPWITELLTNFGHWGVVLGMALIGIFLGLLDRLFNSENTEDLSFIFGLTLFHPLVYPESNFSVMVGSIPLLILGFYLYFFLGNHVIKFIENLLNLYKANKADSNTKQL